MSTRDNPVPVAAALTGGKLLGGLARRFRAPSERRASGPSQQLVASANAGNATAATAIYYRQSVGIEKERAVWRAAFQQLTPDMQLVGQRFSRQLLALTDHSTPESAVRTALANARDVATLATPTSARVKPKKVAQDAPGATNGREQVSQGRGRRARAPRAERAPKVRLVTRYNPETGARARVPNDSIEAAEWPSRKPARKRASRTAAAVRSRALTAGSRAIAVGGLKLAGAARAAGAAAGLGITATGAAIVGAFGLGFAIGTAINRAAAYLSKTERDQRRAMAFRAARLKAAQDNGRPLTDAELREMGRGYKASLTR
jgi:hypothetical protein